MIFEMSRPTSGMAPATTRSAGTSTRPNSAILLSATISRCRAGFVTGTNDLRTASRDWLGVMPLRPHLATAHLLRLRGFVSRTVGPLMGDRGFGSISLHRRRHPPRRFRFHDRDRSCSSGRPRRCACRSPGWRRPLPGRRSISRLDAAREARGDAALIEEPGSHVTRWWRERDSNPRSPVRGTPSHSLRKCSR
jgi:hypothetical protein